MDAFYEILKIAWVVPEGGLSEEALLAIEDGSVEAFEDGSGEIGDAPQKGFSDEAEHGEEEAMQEDDPPVEPAAVPAEPVPSPKLPSDPYMEKAASLMKLRSPRLDENQDSQMLRASSEECMTATPDSAVAPGNMVPITPKKLFQEEDKLVLTTDDMSIALARMREQLRQKLFNELEVFLGLLGLGSVIRYIPGRAELVRRLQASEKAPQTKGSLD